MGGPLLTQVSIQQPPIGEQTVVTARDVMQVTSAHVEPADSLVTAAKVMRDTRLAHIPVCDNGRLIGVVTRDDIVHRCVADGRDPQTTPASELVRPTEATVTVDASLEMALIVMAEYRVRGLPVLDGDTFVGVLAQADVTRSLAL